MFEPVPEILRGHIKGYITDGDVSNNPIDAVHSCNNMDFYPEHDRRRKPISLKHDLSAALPDGYKIIQYKEKRVLDIDGNSKDILLAVTKNTSDIESELKIYCKGFFSPNTDYENCYKTSGFGWNDEIVELTERVESEITNVANGDQSESTFDVDDVTGLFNTTADHYNGFFVYRKTTDTKDYKCIGIVTDYSYAAATASFTVNRRSYIETEDPYVRYIPLISNDETLIFARFPVNFLNMDNWANVDDVDIQEGYNHFILSCGHLSRPVWIGFIADRTSFSGGYYADPTIVFSGSSTNDMAFSGTYVGEDARDFIIEIHSSSHIGGGIYLNTWKWKRAGDVSWIGTLAMNGNWVLLQDGINIRFSTPNIVHGVGDTWTIAINGSDAGIKRWNGFWMAYLSPFVPGKKVYRVYQQATSGPKHIVLDEKAVGNELGIDYHLKVDSAVGDYHRMRFFSLGVTLNGFETIFVKNLVLQCIISGANYIIHIQEPNVNFNVDFDRRITGINLFHNENSTNAPGFFDITTSRDNEFVATYQVQRDRGGHVPIDGNLIAAVYDSSFNVNKLDFMFHENGQFGPTESLYLNKISKGISLNAYLNQYYWKDINLKFNCLAKVGDYVVAANLSNSSLNDLLVEGITNISEDGRGSICLAQFENGNVVCNSILVSERIRQITDGEEIISLTGFNNNQLLIFTSSKMYYVVITNFKNFTFTTRIFPNRGLVNKKGLTTAQIQDEFGGIYWVNPMESIFGFANNKPVDLLQDKWQYEFQKFSNNVKNAAVCGFFPDQREIYVYINSKIYIYSMKYNHWKIHNYPVTPELFERGIEGLITFSNGNKIYQREPINSSSYKDLGTTRIDFHTEQYISHKSTSYHKIFNTIDAHFDVTPEFSGGEPLDTFVYVKAGRENESVSDLMDQKLPTSSLKLFNRIAVVRKHISYYRFTIQSDNSTAAYVIDFIRREINLVALAVKKFITKE